MPKGYVVFTEAILDQQALDAYAKAAVPSVLAAGGRAIIASPPHAVIEGSWHGDTTVVLEFDSLQAATDWYHGDAYQAVAPARHGAAQTNAAIFEAFEMPTA